MAEVTPSRVRNQDRELVICALYSGGETMDAVGKVFGVSRERIRQILERNDLGGVGCRTKIDPLKVLGLVKECDSAKAISRRLGVNVTAVSRVLHALAPTAHAEMTAYWMNRCRDRALPRLLALAERLGRTPTKQDLDKHGPAVDSLQKWFGSLSAAQKAAGLVPHKRSHPRLTKEQRTALVLRYDPGVRRGFVRIGGNAKELAEEFGLTVQGVWYHIRTFKVAA